MINTYYLLQNGQQIGPYTQYELMAMDLNGQDMVLSPLADDWQEALDLPEFAEYFETKGIYLPTRANLASFWWRVLAYFIDYVIILLMVVILFSALAIFSSFTGGPITDEYIDNNEPLIKLVAVVLMITYHATFEATTLRGSIGKMICKLAVVDINGERLKFGNALSRNLGKILSAMVMGLGFLNILWDKKRQGWHDGLAKTYVVRKP